MSCIRPRDFHHTGFVVESIRSAMERFTAMAGYRWMTPVEHPVPVRLPSGEKVVSLQMVYSIDEPRIELIREVPGTPWTCSTTGGAHHVGYLVDDLTAASAALTELGMALEIQALGSASRSGGFAYHRGTDGIRIEIVNRSVLSDIADLIRRQQKPSGSAA